MGWVKKCDRIPDRHPLMGLRNVGQRSIETEQERDRFSIRPNVCQQIQWFTRWFGERFG